MTGNGRFTLPVDPTAAVFSVGRITNHQIKGFGRQGVAYGADIGMDNLEAMLQLIVPDIFPGQRDEIVLNLDRSQRDPG